MRNVGILILKQIDRQPKVRLRNTHMIGGQSRESDVRKMLKKTKNQEVGKLSETKELR